MATTLTNLQKINVNRREYSIPESALLTLPNLTSFRNLESDINDLAQALCRWTNLEYLYLDRSSAAVSDIDLFSGNHSKLTKLVLFMPPGTKTITERWLNSLDNVKAMTIVLPEEDDENTEISLKSMTALQKISVSCPKFCNFSCQNLTYLEIERANDRFFERELDNLCNLRHLEVMFMDSDDSESPMTYKWLRALTALENVWMSPVQCGFLSLLPSSLTSLDICVTGEKFEDLDRLKNLCSLKHFCINLETANTSLSTIQTMTQLEMMRITLPPQVDFDIHLPTFSNLTCLHLAVKSADVSCLPNLERLILTYGTRESFFGFTDLPKLTSLYVWHRSGVYCDASFVSNLTTLKEIFLSPTIQLGCQLFSTLTDLESLYFHRNAADDYEHFSAMTKLTKLTLAYGIFSPSLVHLPTSLQILSLGTRAPQSPAKSEIINRVMERMPNLYSANL